jgi:AcrR family transcriptional regulator
MGVPSSAGAHAAAPDGLEARLVAAGVGLLRAEGVAALSLREIARRAGVSHGAPRRYFPTHAALLSAIARTGFADLTAQVSAALAREPADPVATLARLYVRFGRRDPHMVELMFRHDLLESGGSRLREASLPLFRLLVTLQPGGSVAAAAALWANLHGIVQLWNSGSLPLATGDLDAVVTAALEAHLP